jgi:hypothetical protein
MVSDMNEEQEIEAAAIPLPANTPLPAIEQRSSITIEQEQEPLTIDQG